MSWSQSCMLPWDRLDIGRVHAAIVTAVAEAAKQWPLYAGSRIEVDGDSVHVFFPAALVEKPHWEIDPPEGPDADGMYPCTFRHFYIAAEPKWELEAQCGVSLDSNTSANRQAWMTACKVLDGITTVLGGTSRDF